MFKGDGSSIRLYKTLIAIKFFIALYKAVQKVDVILAILVNLGEMERVVFVITYLF